jgi:hypothetical protein
MVRMAQPHKDYSRTPLPEKLGIREGARVYVAGAPEGFDAVLGPLPTGVQRLARAGSAMDVVLLFVTRERDLRARFAKLAAGLEPAGRLWVAAEEVGSAPDRPRLRHRATDRPRRGARRQQERVGDR